jgi:hypothetical protein
MVKVSTAERSILLPAPPALKVPSPMPSQSVQEYEVTPGKLIVETLVPEGRRAGRRAGQTAGRGEGRIPLRAPIFRQTRRARLNDYCIAGRQPAACVSASEQNHRSPRVVSITVFA